MTKKRRSKKPSAPPRGLLPADDERAKWEGLGYRLPRDIATSMGVARSTVYGWIERGAITPIDARDAVVKMPASGNVWVLLEAAKRLRPDPESIVKGSEAE